MLYQLSKRVARFVVGQFFRRITIGGEPALESGPLLIVCNHQNSIVDPLLVIRCFERELWFIAKSTYFNGSFISALLRSINMVPVKRRQDFPNGEVDNQKMFQFTTDALAKGKAILIFPEGLSLGVRKLQPIKTGAARISLQAEADNKFSLGLKVQAVGITYTDVQRFRSSAHVVLGKPFSVRELYQDASEGDRDITAVLTERIETELRGLTVDVAEVEQNRLVEQIAKLYASADRAADDFNRLHQVAERVAQLSAARPGARDTIARRLSAYEEAASLWNIDIDRPLKQQMNPIAVRLLTPAVVFGYISHYLPYKLIGPLGRAIIDHPASIASMKILLGIVVYPIWYLCLFFLGLACGISSGLASLLVLAVILAGLLANKYYDGVHLYLVNGKGSPLDALLSVRNELIYELDRLNRESSQQG
ncbi:MAG: 1-acyl-sn-glycerol-3-phosphate acyltransferase [Bdellovibrionales bacterium]|nr:1-acyl-sn-glycerol-3-phosphate acyltransferase [Bdellovibrionales bacterium]